MGEDEPSLSDTAKKSGHVSNGGGGGGGGGGDGGGGEGKSGIAAPSRQEGAEFGSFAGFGSPGKDGSDTFEEGERGDGEDNGAAEESDGARGKSEDDEGEVMAGPMSADDKKAHLSTTAKEPAGAKDHKVSDTEEAAAKEPAPKENRRGVEPEKYQTAPKTASGGCLLIFNHLGPPPSSPVVHPLCVTSCPGHERRCVCELVPLLGARRCWKKSSKVGNGEALALICLLLLAWPARENPCYSPCLKVRASFRC